MYKSYNQHLHYSRSDLHRPTLLSSRQHAWLWLVIAGVLSVARSFASSQGGVVVSHPLYYFNNSQLAPPLHEVRGECYACFRAHFLLRSRRRPRLQSIRQMELLVHSRNNGSVPSFLLGAATLVAKIFG